MSNEFKKHTLATLLFAYGMLVFLLFIKNFATSSDESAVAMFVFMILLVNVYYMYEYKNGIVRKILLILGNIICSLILLSFIGQFDFKISLFLISIIGLNSYFFFYQIKE